MFEFLAIISSESEEIATMEPPHHRQQSGAYRMIYIYIYDMYMNVYSRGLKSEQFS